MTSKKPFYQVVAERLISQLEDGTAPFQKPWKPGEFTVPHNPVSGSKYKGSNAFWLTMQGRSDPRWMTYKQAQSINAQVKKGEKGTLIQYWKFHETSILKDKNGKTIFDEDGKPKKTNIELDRPKVFSAVVFNAEQIEGLPELETKSLNSKDDFKRHERAESILNNIGISINHDQSDKAFYRPSTDSIHLPKKEQFISPDRYYAIALHEVGHATGHHSRLNRDLTGDFGSESYAREELRAEIASLMIGDELEIGHDPGHHASYVGSWIKVLREDPKEILRAAKDAEAIKNFVMEREITMSITNDSTTKDLSSSNDSNYIAAIKIAEKFSSKLDENNRQKFINRVAIKLSENSAPTIKVKSTEKLKQQEFDFEH